MTDKPRMLAHTNAPWAGTGYGQQCALFAPRLAEHYNLSISAFYGLEGSVIPWKGIPVLPGIAQTYGNETISEHVGAFLGSDPRNGLVFTLMDVWVLDTAVWRNFNTCAWVPVDHEPAPRPVLRFFEESGAVPLAMSRFGQEQLAEFDPIYVPHGVDASVYKPLDKKKARAEVGMPEDAFIVGMVAANKGNPSRKCFSEAFQAFKALHDKQPDARLFLHTEVTGRFQGVNLPELMAAIGVDRDSVIFCDQYRVTHLPFNAETMASIYSAIDVLLAPSAGEGFGIPVVEAQACGTPVIVSDFSAQPELVGAGWTVEGTKVWTPIGSWQVRPDVPDIVEALEDAYDLSGARKDSFHKQARAKAEEYDADRVFTDHMLPALEECQDRFDARQPVTLKAAA